MNDALLAAALKIAFGALAGGLTNSVAIWMLFHPYEPPRLLGRWRLKLLQGAIPKNQPRLAAAIGRTVGNRLLTPDDLARTFADESFRRAFDQRLQAFLNDVLHTERGSLRELIHPRVMSDLEALLDEAVERGLEHLVAYVDSEDFERVVAERTQGFIEAARDEPIGDLLTPARGAALEAAVRDWIAAAVESPDFEAAVEDYLIRASRRLLEPGRTFEEVLPSGLVSSLEKAIAGYLPLAAHRLGGLLEDESARERFEAMIHDLLHRFLRDLKFHQRVVARLVMTEDTVDKVLDTIEAEGSERLSEILRDPAVQDAIARGVNEAIVDFLRRPVAEVLGEPDDANVQEARATLARWVVQMARDPATRDFLVEKLHRAVERAGARTWGEVLDRVPAEKVTRALVVAARTETARNALRRSARGLVRRLLDQPIGTPARWLPDHAAERIERALSDPLWDWLQTQVPVVVQQIDVARRVEEKVLHFPMDRLEDLVRRVTDRELVLIVRLGYVLGAFIGTILVVVDAVLG